MKHVHIWEVFLRWHLQNANVLKAGKVTERMVVVVVVVVCVCVCVWGGGGGGGGGGGVCLPKKCNHIFSAPELK